MRKRVAEIEELIEIADGVDFARIANDLQAQPEAVSIDRTDDSERPPTCPKVDARALGPVSVCRFPRGHDGLCGSNDPFVEFVGTEPTYIKPVPATYIEPASTGYEEIHQPIYVKHPQCQKIQIQKGEWRHQTIIQCRLEDGHVGAHIFPRNPLGPIVEGAVVQPTWRKPKVVNRRQKGALRQAIFEACLVGVRGSVVDLNTASRIGARARVIIDDGRPVSVGAVIATWERWEKLGYCVLDKTRPMKFVNFTALGYDKLSKIKIGKRLK